MANKGTIHFIDEKIWAHVNEADYYVEKVNHIIYLMKKENYSLLNIPNEFAKKYEELYLDYAKGLIMEKPMEFLFLDEDIAVKHLDEINFQSGKLSEIGTENMDKILERRDYFKSLVTEKEQTMDKK